MATFGFIIGDNSRTNYARESVKSS